MLLEIPAGAVSGQTAATLYFCLRKRKQRITHTPVSVTIVGENGGGVPGFEPATLARRPDSSVDSAGLTSKRRYLGMSLSALYIYTVA